VAAAAGTRYSRRFEILASGFGAARGRAAENIDFITFKLSDFRIFPSDFWRMAFAAGSSMCKWLTQIKLQSMNAAYIRFTLQQISYFSYLTRNLA